MPWPYKSERDLVDAGYKLRGPVACPLCGRSVAMWFRPSEAPVFVDPETLQPHLAYRHIYGEIQTDDPADGKTAAAGRD